jgi:hypothetical protein
MKKLFLLPLILFFAGCQLSNGSEKKQLFAHFRSVTLPAAQQIVDYRMQWQSAQLKMMEWIDIPGSSESKPKLKIFVSDDYPKIRSGLKDMVTRGVLTNKSDVDAVLLLMEQEINCYHQIMDDLSTVAQYNDPTVLFPIQDMMMGSDGVCKTTFQQIDKHLEDLTQKINFVADQELMELEK